MMNNFNNVPENHLPQINDVLMCNNKHGEIDHEHPPTQNSIKENKALGINITRKDLCNENLKSLKRKVRERY